MSSVHKKDLVVVRKLFQLETGSQFQDSVGRVLKQNQDLVCKAQRKSIKVRSKLTKRVRHERARSSPDHGKKMGGLIVCDSL